MYQEAGYGTNWRPTENNASRLDPYTRVYVLLAGLVAIGFVLIVIVVLSLIPVYISHSSSPAATNTYIQVSKVYVSNYKLQVNSPVGNMDSQMLLSLTKNRHTLQAALTSMIQHDLTVNGSVITINASAVKTNGRRRRRQISSLITINLDLNVVSGKSCSSVVCMNDFRSRIINLLTNPNENTLIARYEPSDSTLGYWFYYQLPVSIQTNVSLVYIDPKSISSTLYSLLLIDRTKNQPSVQSSTPNILV